MRLRARAQPAGRVRRGGRGRPGRVRGRTAGAGVALHVTPAASVADQPVRITVSGLTPGRWCPCGSGLLTPRTRPGRRRRPSGPARPAGSARPGWPPGPGATPAGRRWACSGPWSRLCRARPRPTTGPGPGLGLRPQRHRARQHAGSARLTRRWLARHGRGAYRGGLGVRRPVLPAPGVPAGPRRPAVLIIGGSQGGLSSPLLAAALAGHGYPVLTIAYFAAPGLPASLCGYPAGVLRPGAALAAPPAPG